MVSEEAEARTTRCAVKRTRVSLDSHSHRRVEGDQGGMGPSLFPVHPDGLNLVSPPFRTILPPRVVSFRSEGKGREGDAILPPNGTPETRSTPTCNEKNRRGPPGPMGDGTEPCTSRTAGKRKETDPNQDPRARGPVQRCGHRTGSCGVRARTRQREEKTSPRAARTTTKGQRTSETDRAKMGDGNGRSVRFAERENAQSTPRTRPLGANRWTGPRTAPGHAPS